MQEMQRAANMIPLHLPQPEKCTAFGNADVQNLTENGYEIAGVKKG